VYGAVRIATGKFADDPANKANLNCPAERGERWQNFTNWLMKEFQRQIEAESERVQAETAKAAANRVQAMQMFTAAGAAFITFVLFTLMLVLRETPGRLRPSLWNLPRRRSRRER
jgi:hypothetical protein